MKSPLDLRGQAACPWATIAPKSLRGHSIGFTRKLDSARSAVRSCQSLPRALGPRIFGARAVQKQAFKSLDAPKSRYFIRRLVRSFGQTRVGTAPRLRVRPVYPRLRRASCHGREGRGRGLEGAHHDQRFVWGGKSDGRTAADSFVRTEGHQGGGGTDWRSPTIHHQAARSSACPLVGVVGVITEHSMPFAQVSANFVHFSAKGAPAGADVAMRAASARGRVGRR